MSEVIGVSELKLIVSADDFTPMMFGEFRNGRGDNDEPEIVSFSFGLGFTNSPLVEFTHISPHRNSPRNQQITTITIHHFAGNATLEAMGDWLSRPGTLASYNYGIESSGRIGLFVEERDRCWGSSSSANDNRAVVIGVANNTGAPNWGISSAAFESLINLCIDICRRNGGIVQVNGLSGLNYNGTNVGSLTRHNFFSNTLCPGPFLQDRFPEIVRRVNEALHQENVLEDLNMTRQELISTIRSEIRDARGPVYDSIADVPDWGRGAVKRLKNMMDAEGLPILRGDNQGRLGITEDFLRTIVIWDRKGI